MPKGTQTMKLSILVPVYNENLSVERVVESVLRQEIPGIKSREVVIVDDGSSDGTTETLAALARKYAGQVVAEFHPKNLGKGAAVRTAVLKMSGDVCLIQDADLEYSPTDYPLLLEPIIAGRADCVFGSRFIGSQSKRVLYFWHSVGNKLLTLFSNMCTNLNLTDMETGYKAFRAEIIKDIPIRSKDFGFEPEITAKISRRKCRIYEVGINYSGRTYQEGKKITWVDGFRAIFVIMKFWIIDDSRHSQ